MRDLVTVADERLTDEIMDDGISEPLARALAERDAHLTMLDRLIDTADMLRTREKEERS